LRLVFDVVLSTNLIEAKNPVTGPPSVAADRNWTPWLVRIVWVDQAVENCTKENFEVWSISTNVLLTPYRSAKDIMISFLRGAVQRTAAVVVALAWRI